MAVVDSHPPHTADSEDTGHYAPDVPVYSAIFPNATAEFPFPEATYVAIGKDFYALSANMPPGTDL